MDDPTNRDPASFPGNPNPPAKIPDTSGVKSAPAAEPTSAGTGALPPSAAGGDVPPSSPAAPSDKTAFRVYSEEDGGHSIYALKDEGSGYNVGSATSTYTQKILDATGTFNPTTKSWDVPPEIAKSLMTGRLGFPEQIAKSWEGGETGVVQAFNAMAWIDGKMPFEEAKARNDQMLLKEQLAPSGQAGLAWDKLGQYAADALKHPGDALAEVGKYTVKQLAAFAPVGLQVAGGAMEGAVKVGGPAAAAAGLSGTLELPPVAAGVAWLTSAGALAGASKTLINLEIGGAASRMMQQGLPEDIIRSNAVWQGSAKGLLWMTSAALLPGPMKLKLLETLAESPAAQKMAANWAIKYGGQVAAGTSLMVAQEKIRQIFNNMAASAANRPDLLIQGKEGLDQLLDAAASGASITAAMGAYGAAKGAMKPTPEGGAGAPQAAGVQGQEPAPAGAPQSGEPAVAASASGSPEGKIEPGSQTTEGVAAPLDPSVTEHPTFVKAAEEAKPFLGKIDPTDKEGVIGAYSDIVQEHHDFINKVQVAMAKDKVTDAMSNKMQAQAEKMASLSRLAKILHDPEKALPYFKAFDDGKESLLPPPADPYDVAKAAREMEDKAGAGAPPEPPASKGEGAAADEPAGENKYVLNREMDVKSLGDEKTTAKNARDEYSGIHNEQLVRGNQLAEELKRDVPDPKDRQGMFWYKAAEGDKAVLEHALEDPDLEKYHDQIERALNLPDHAVEALKKVDQYYKESGQVSSDVGTIRNVLENYQNRLYEKDGEPTRTEGSASGLKQTTGHAKQRVFDTEFEAARAGKTFATTDVADALALHNGEMSRVNAARSLADKMAESGLGAWKSPDNAPEGWKQVGSLSKDIALKGKDGQALIGEDGNQVHSRSNFYAPEGIADGLKAIADPDWTKKMDALKNVQSAQGAVKTGFLSWSFFHHLSFISQLVYRGDFSSLMQLGNMDAALSHPDFLENEKDFALHGGMTSAVEANADIERALAKAGGESWTEGDKTFKGAVNDAKELPLVKQVLEQTDKNANFLFGKMQRLWKTNTYAAERSNWIASHLDATNEEVTTALRGIAASTNDIFGGQNWEAMGMTKSNLSLLRLGILAPDWTASNMSLLKHAVGLGDNAAENSMSRAHLIKSLAVGMIGTELMNKVLTGHTTDKNKPGHKLEVEVAPNVYVSLIRGGPSDILKLGSMVGESGAAGADRFAAGKLSPAARIIIGLASNTQYGSKQVVPQKDKTKPVAATYDVLKYVLSNASPIPLGISNLMQYAGEKHKTAVGAAMVGSGVGRYSPPPKKAQE